SSGIKDRVSSRDVAFSLSPKLNAPGRVSKPYVSLKLLLEKDKERAKRLLMTIEKLNEFRKALTQKAFEQALLQVQSQLEDSVLIVRLEEWAGGVAGIVAGRLASLFSKPAVVFSVGKEESTASVRGVEGMDVYSALEGLSHMFLKWGGHTSAAGLTIKTKDLELFERLAKEAFSKIEVIAPCLYIDMPLSLDQITPSLVRELDSLEPYGEGFPEPLFLSEPVPLQELEGNESRLTLKVKGKRLTSWDVSLNKKLLKILGTQRRLVYQIDRRYEGQLGILVDVEA
ncbi:MAG: single-stranded-DNA-specific exonuclease RecJ, partial [Aquificota bacterium]